MQTKSRTDHVCVFRHCYGHSGFGAFWTMHLYYLLNFIHSYIHISSSSTYITTAIHLCQLPVCAYVYNTTLFDYLLVMNMLVAIIIPRVADKRKRDTEREERDSSQITNSFLEQFSNRL